MITSDRDSQVMIRYSSLFRSRWLALLWSAGIIWSAVEFADSQDGPGAESANEATVDGADLKQVQELVDEIPSRSER